MAHLGTGVFPCLRVLHPGRSVCSVCTGQHDEVQPGTTVFATERVRLQWVIARFALVALAHGQARGPASGGGPSRKAVAILHCAFCRISVGDLCMAVQIVADPCPPARSMMAGHDAGYTTRWDVVARLNWR